MCYLQCNKVHKRVIRLKHLCHIQITKTRKHNVTWTKQRETSQRWQDHLSRWWGTMQLLGFTGPHLFKLCAQAFHLRSQLINFTVLLTEKWLCQHRHRCRVNAMLRGFQLCLSSSVSMSVIMCNYNWKSQLMSSQCKTGMISRNINISFIHLSKYCCVIHTMTNSVLLIKTLL